jgi:hypothetical protein
MSEFYRSHLETVPQNPLLIDNHLEWLYNVCDSVKGSFGKPPTELEVAATLLIKEKTPVSLK